MFPCSVVSVSKNIPLLPSLSLSELCIDGLKTNPERTYQAAQQGYSNATELADYLVAKGIPFREAHHIVGVAVVAAIGMKKPLEDLTVAELKQFSDVIEDDIYQHLTIEACLEKRVALGGTSKEQVKAAIASKTK